jgi:hypothetical protein
MSDQPVSTGPKPAPKAVSRESLEIAGFKGFVSIRELRRTRMADVPCGPGVYAVLRSDTKPPGFRRTSGGGWFKCKDPSVPVSVLRARWIDAADAVYVGRAAGSADSRGDLRMRLAKLLAFGGGLPIDHWGGRYLWQLTRSEDLIVCWKIVPDPTKVERRLILQFTRAYGGLPFANLHK